jgi:glucose-6-phosphate 1-dehydrogenase
MVTVIDTPVIANPLREGLRQHRTAEPCAMVIFGITGDLAHRKLLPALYNLYVTRQLPGGFSVIGFARRPFSDEELRAQVKESVEKFSRNKPSQRPSVWESFAEGLFYVQGNFDDAKGFKALAQKLKEIDEQRGTGGNRVYYLSTPPEFYEHIIGHLGASGLANRRIAFSMGEFMRAPRATQADTSWRRIIIEKPFGHDLASAQELNAQLSEVFTEEQIYRIDHYLGKETVQNILVFRFANGIWEPIWSRRYIDHVQITVAESLGVEDRASYYDTAGALRDMLQNHMMQLLTLVAMEPPASFDAQAVRDEKAKILRAIKPFTLDEVEQNVVRGQYGPGAIFGKAVRGYRQE